MAQNGMDIDVIRGDTLSLSLTYLGNIAARSKLWFTVKEDKPSKEGGVVSGPTVNLQE